MHGEHAFAVARHLYRSTAQVTYIGGREAGLPGITVPHNLLPSALKELLVERGEHAVEVYEGAGASWKCVKRGSPGMWRDFEGELSRAGDLTDAPVVVSVVVSMVEGAFRGSSVYSLFVICNALRMRMSHRSLFSHLFALPLPTNKKNQGPARWGWRLPTSPPAAWAPASSWTTSTFAT